MLTGVEVAGLVFGAMGLVPIFKEAYKVVQARRRAEAPDTTKLAEEIRNGELSLTSRYQEFHGVYGDAFAKGDGIARESLKDLIIQLQHGLLIELQRGGQIYNPSSLVTITITGRNDAFTMLAELAQRLAAAMPINRLDPYQGNERPSAKRLSIAKLVIKALPRLALAIVSAAIPARSPHPYDVEEKLEAEERYKYIERIPRVTPRPATAIPRRRRLNWSEIEKRTEVLPQTLSAFPEQPARTSRGPQKCNVCNRMFGDSCALGDHLRDSVSHRKKVGRRQRLRTVSPSSVMS